MRVNDDQVVFNIFQAMKYLEEIDDYFVVDLIQGAIVEVQDTGLSSDPFEQALIFNDLHK